MKGGTSVVLCRTSVQNGSVETWYNNGFAPSKVDSANPQLGLSDTRVLSVGGVFICSFTRQNSVSNARYYNVDNSSLPYLIAAFGSGNAKLYKNFFKAFFKHQNDLKRS